jgi:uncharacterized protein (TIGR04255 family)
MRTALEGFVAEMSDTTPHFQKPPVVETVLSVQFDRLGEFRTVHFGLLWEMLRDKFPITDELPPLPAIREAPGKRLKLSLEHAPQWGLIPQEPLPRVLYRKRETDIGPQCREVIQIQNDRFIHNWARASAGTQEYPTYRVNRAQFLAAFQQFSQFVSTQKIGEIRPNTLEVTYINRIPLTPGGVEELVRRTFPALALQRSDPFLPQVESVVVDQSFPIASARGHLHVKISAPVVLRSDEEVIDFRLTALVAPIDVSGNSLEEALDLAHTWVVNGFRSMTSPEMHAQWE